MPIGLIVNRSSESIKTEYIIFRETLLACGYTTHPKRKD